MSEEINHNALLLQVMAHDLLAPLTAVKWQMELLGREGLDSAKRFTYMQNVHDSTELGITLTKHAHVAGRVLVGSYDVSTATVSLPEVIRNAAMDLRLQYERHGVVFDVAIEDEPTQRTIDTELVGLFVWSLAKFFLSCTPANSSVSLRGIAANANTERASYTLIGSAANIPDPEQSMQVFTNLVARSSYDEAFVFAKLLREVAPKLGVTISASVQGPSLVIEASFDTAS